MNSDFALSQADELEATRVEARRPNSEIEPVRLVKFMTRFGLGGTERQVANLAARLDRERFDLRFACLMRWGEWVPEIESRGISIDEYPINRLYGFRTWARQRQFSRALVARRTQIMHSYNFYANVFSIPAARLARVPCVMASVRDLGVYMTPAQCRVQRWACGLADLVLVNAEAIRTWLLDQGLPARKLRVIHNGVDVGKFRLAIEDHALRKELGIPQAAPLIVMIARLHPKKGTEYLLRAAPSILERFPDAHFVVVGEAYLRDQNDNIWPDPSVRERLAARAAELGVSESMHFIGVRQDVPEILSTATISILPSLSEGLSNTLLESMAAGVPVVATHVGGTPEAIRDGRDGLLIRPGNVGDIVTAIRAILEDPVLARQLSVQGQERAMRSFSFDAMTRKTENTYLELLESKHRYKKKARREVGAP